ncbi:MAG: CAP domain-containing protein, partial [Ruminiclostridium sp.]|nr:CAP domain-containing protein [Ruminiclostridium sp.]
HSSRTTTEITAPTLPYSSQVTSSAPTSVISRSDTTTGITTAPTTAGTVTAPSTVSVTTRRTTASGASTTAHSTKAPFINVGGGVFSEDDNVYLTMFRLVNNARKAAGLKDLWYSARVSEICKLRAGELSSYYSHTRPDGSRFSSAYTDLGIKYKSCGENIAYGRNMFKTPEEVFKAWMDSPSHRENILNPDFECVAFGLSILKVDNDTYYYWAQEFASLG